MRASSAELPGVLLGSFDYHWQAVLTYNGEQRIAALPITDPKFDEDGSASIQQTGSCTVVWSDELASSIVPQYVNDALAPFGAQLWITCVITAGPFSEAVTFGRFVITDVPSARDAQMRFHGSWLTLGSKVELTLKELTADIAAETFDAPGSPSDLSSTWAEVARITGLPVSRTVEDAAITRSVLYQDGKLDVVYDLMDVMLDAVPHMTAAGAVSARPNTWPDPVATLTRADHLVEVGNLMSAASVYNRVVVRATGSDQTSVLAVAEITEGPLRVREPDGSRSPFGQRTYYQSSELVTTEVQAQAWAESTLPQVSTLRAQVLPVTEIFNPLRERGDVVLIERATRWLLGRVQKISRSGGATQSLHVEIGAVTPK